MRARLQRFDATLLLAAVDAERQARGLSWTALARQVGVSLTTIRGMAGRAAVEADGALALCRWLGVAPEGFAGPAGGGALAAGRADARALHAALAQALEARGVGWAELAAEVSAAGPPTAPATLARLARGGRMDIDRLVILAGWLGRPVADFVRIAPT